jgi:hypothetical protein
MPAALRKPEVITMACYPEIPKCHMQEAAQAAGKQMRVQALQWVLYLLRAFRLSVIGRRTQASPEGKASSLGHLLDGKSTRGQAQLVTGFWNLFPAERTYLGIRVRHEEEDCNGPEAVGASRITNRTLEDTNAYQSFTTLVDRLHTAAGEIRESLTECGPGARQAMPLQTAVPASFTAASIAMVTAVSAENSTTRVKIHVGHHQTRRT